MKSSFHWPRTLILVVSLSVYTCLYFTKLAAGFQGISHSIGFLWAIVAIVAQAYRVTLPLTVAAYWHAMVAWGWHPAIAVLLATLPETWVEIEQFTSLARIGARRTLWPGECAWVLSTIPWRCFQVAVLVAGFQGIHNSAGFPYAILAVAALLTCRFDLPLTVGAYLHATHAWGWHPAMAVLFAAGPTLCLLFRLFTARTLQSAR
jgi:hypothetical protein